MKRHILRAGVLACALSSMAAQSAVVLEGTRIVHDAGKGRDVTLRSTNQGDQPALTQVWIDDGDGNARPEEVVTPFRLTPSEPRLLKPGEGQAWRITYAPRPSDAPVPPDRESVFYLNLLDIPPKPRNAQDSNLLQFAVRTRIKLFHRPAGLQGNPAHAALQLVWRQAGHCLDVANPSAYHVTLGSVTLGDGVRVDADMVPPGGRIELPLPQGQAMPATVAFTWLDDYGAMREARATVQAPTPASTEGSLQAGQ
ncbi:fimbria/pilus periplasmic chaperone [Xanthomonas sp. 60]